MTHFCSRNDSSRDTWKNLLQTWYTSYCEAESVPHSRENSIQLVRQWIQQYAFIDSKMIYRLLRWLLNLPVSDNKELVLRHIEWQVVVIFELYVTVPSLLFLEQFSKCRRKLERSKRKRDELGPPEQILKDFLIQQLTRVVFCLPPNEPFATFLQQRCLTRCMWQKLPKVVQDIFDFFEIVNPYLLCTNVDKPEETQILKKPKRRKPFPVPHITAPPPRRPLIKTTNNVRRIGHFHGMLTDMEKLLDDSDYDTTPKSRPIQQQLIVTPQSMSTSKSSTLVTNSNKGSNHKKGTFSSLSTSNSKLVPFVDDTPKVTNQATVLPTHSPIVADELVSSTRRDATESPVTIAKSPVFHDVSDSDAKILHDRFVSDISHVKPVKLFAAISKKPTTLSQDKQPRVQEPKTKKRSTSLAVAAASSFLRRKSL